jgi:hypothetical protein
LHPDWTSNHGCVDDISAIIQLDWYRGPSSWHTARLDWEDYEVSNSPSTS